MSSNIRHRRRPATPTRPTTGLITRVYKHIKWVLKWAAAALLAYQTLIFGCVVIGSLTVTRPAAQPARDSRLPQPANWSCIASLCDGKTWYHLMPVVPLHDKAGNQSAVTESLIQYVLVDELDAPADIVEDIRSTAVVAPVCVTEALYAAAFNHAHTRDIPLVSYMPDIAVGLIGKMYPGVMPSVAFSELADGLPETVGHSANVTWADAVRNLTVMCT